MKQTMKQRNALTDYNQRTSKKKKMIKQIVQDLALRQAQRKRIINRVGYVGLLFVQLSILPNLIFGIGLITITTESCVPSSATDTRTSFL